MKGDIVLVPFPNSDLTLGKLRPALVLYEDAIENETTIAYISSKTPIILSPCDILITRGTPSFDESGLKLNSVITGLLGFADEVLQAEVNRAIDACLKFPASPAGTR